VNSRFDDFMSAKAWRYSAVEGLRGAVVISVTVLVVNIAGALFFLHSVWESWLLQTAKLSLLAFGLGFLLFTPYARWTLWRNNRVKRK
jgi:hypothetical protein